MDCYITQTGHYLPGPPIPNDRIEDFLGSLPGESQVKRQAGKVVFVAFVIFAVWSVTAPLDKGVVLFGKVVVQGSRKAVQHPSGGVVSEIMVREGDEVKEGDVVLRINPLNVDANLLRENLIKQYEQFGTTKFVIMDDLYNDNYDKVRDLHENCWSKLPFKPELAGYLRLDLLWRHPEQAEMLRADGWRACSVGIETLHDKAGKSVGKGLGKKRILETLEMLKEVWQDEVLIHAFFIAGLPHEPIESLEETYKWTQSTDLIHAVIWHWLELENIQTMPKVVDKISIIGKDHKKYGYTFLNNSDWVSNNGVTLDQAKEFNRRANTAKMNTYFTLYADMRALGMSHNEIMTANKNVDFMSYVNWENNIKQPASRDRLLKIITND